ncbi:sugar ABC transporter substrate-binding protein [Ectobacillus funiculus]|uniref:sugar ABC transporter substrate-binding protein n=1 Tax=Ectobacillus funiculus TaxID=137993 RepID=UPI00101D4B48|nr:sugar ABC transporter substrate-binding protein [Ectobacillus funiculus]
MKRRWIIFTVCLIFLIILLVFILKLFTKDDQPKIVVVSKVIDIEYWRLFESGANKAFEDFQIDGKVVAPGSADATAKQLDILKSVIREKPDAIIVTPIQPSAIMPILEEYKKKNIPVLLADTDAEWKDKVTYIGTDNLEFGKKAGELLASMLYPGDQVALIKGPSSFQMMTDRIKGAKEALEDAGMEIVTEQSGYDDSFILKSVMKDILQTYPAIKGVITADDVLALDALKILDKTGTKIPVVGADGITEMIKFVKEGKLSATLGQNPYDMGYLSVEQALRAIKGETVRKRIDSGVDIITQDNAKNKLDFLEEALQFGSRF